MEQRPTLETMPRLKSAERVERVRDALLKALEEIETDLDRRDYDAAWKAASELEAILGQGRAPAAALRARVVFLLNRRERFKLHQIGARFGISVGRAGQLAASGAEDARTISGDELTSEPGSVGGMP
jgi:hypothetical protein